MWIHSAFGSLFWGDGVRSKREMTKKLASRKQCCCFSLTFCLLMFLKMMLLLKTIDSQFTFSLLSLFFHLKQHFTSDGSCKCIQQVISVREVVLMLAGLYLAYCCVVTPITGFSQTLSWKGIREDLNWGLLPVCEWTIRLHLHHAMQKQKNRTYTWHCVHMYAKKRCLRVRLVVLSLYRCVCATECHICVLSCVCLLNTWI